MSAVEPPAGMPSSHGPPPPIRTDLTASPSPQHPGPATSSQPPAVSSPVQEPPSWNPFDGETPKHSDLNRVHSGVGVRPSGHSELQDRPEPQLLELQVLCCKRHLLACVCVGVCGCVHMSERERVRVSESE